MRTGQRSQLLTYLLLIAINLLVLPGWFSPGEFALGQRLILGVLNVGIIAFCAWRISRILGVSPFTRSKRPRYTPYEAPDEDVDAVDRAVVDDVGTAERAVAPESTRRRDARMERSFGQAETFEEYDPYDDAPGGDHPGEPCDPGTPSSTGGPPPPPTPPSTTGAPNPG